MFEPCAHNVILYMHVTVSDHNGVDIFSSSLSPLDQNIVQDQDARKRKKNKAVRFIF